MRSTQTKKAICLRKARFLPCLPFIYHFFSLPNRAPLLKQRCGYGNHLKCHSEEQSDRENPLNRNANTVAIATDRTCSRNLYRATTLLSQNKRDKNSNHNSERVLAWWAHCVCRDKSVQVGIKKSCRSFAKLSAWLAHFVLCFVDMLTEGTVFAVPSFYISLF